MHMENTEAAFLTLLENFLEKEEDLVSVYVFDRDGLIISSASKFIEDDEREMVLGAITGRLEVILRRVRDEFQMGNWSTGTLETEDYRLIFLESGKDAILLMVTNFTLPLNDILPYAFLVAEKISRITNKDFYPGFTVNIPDLQMENILQQSMFEKMKQKNVDISGSGMNPLNVYSMDTYSMKYKTIILGNASVGKTTIVQKFTTGKFRNDYLPTLGISITEQEYDLIGDNQNTVNFMLWDLAGQKFFKRARTTYIRGSQAAFLVYDCTNRKSFEDIREWYNEVHKDTEKIPIVLVGNKIDLKDQRAVTHEEGKALASELKCSFIETSALTGENINEAFQMLGVGLFFKSNQEVEDSLS